MQIFMPIVPCYFTFILVNLEWEEAYYHKIVYTVFGQFLLEMMLTLLR